MLQIDIDEESGKEEEGGREEESGSEESDEESGDEESTQKSVGGLKKTFYPELLLPGWAPSLICYPLLQTVSLHFGGNLFGLDKNKGSFNFYSLEKEWIKSWFQYAPCVKRVYLSHTCDEDLDEDLIEDTGGYLGRNAFWRRNLTGSWKLEASGEEVIWFEDPDVLDQIGDACKDPYE